MNIAWNLLKFESYTVTYYYYRWKQSSYKLDAWVKQDLGHVTNVKSAQNGLKIWGWALNGEQVWHTKKIRLIGALEVAQLEGVFQQNLKILWRLWHWSHKSEVLRDAIDVFGWPKCEFLGQLHEWKALGRKLLFRGEDCLNGVQLGWYLACTLPTYLLNQ
jgi:hypothetical protein